MYDIDNEAPTEEFRLAYAGARRHIGSLESDGIQWLKSSPQPPFLDHISFLLGNQAFFIRLEDLDSILQVPGNTDGLLRISEGCNGHACRLVMKKRIEGGWQPALPGWSLLDAISGKPVDPPSLVTDEEIELTDWEVADFAVQLVAHRLAEEGRCITSAVGHPDVYPHIWINANNTLEWVIVGAARHPATYPSLTADMKNVARHLASKGFKTGYFASVVLASIDDPFDPAAASNGNYRPLNRGVAAVARYSGLVAINH